MNERCTMSMIGTQDDDVCDLPAVATLKPNPGDDGHRCADHAKDYFPIDFVDSKAVPEGRVL